MRRQLARGSTLLADVEGMRVMAPKVPGEPEKPDTKAMIQERMIAEFKKQVEHYQMNEKTQAKPPVPVKPPVLVMPPVLVKPPVPCKLVRLVPHEEEEGEAPIQREASIKKKKWMD